MGILSYFNIGALFEGGPTCAQCGKPIEGPVIGYNVPSGELCHPNGCSDRAIEKTPGCIVYLDIIAASQVIGVGNASRILSEQKR